MDVSKEHRRQKLIDGLLSIARTVLKEQEQIQFDSFAVNALHFYPDAEYLERPMEDIFWSVWGLCCFAQTFSTKTAREGKVHVFAPTQQVDGWTSEYTTIYVDHRDMPFLVDSLRMALNRRGLNIFTLQSNPVWILRNPAGELQEISSSYVPDSESEALMTIEVDLLTKTESMDLHRELVSVLDDVSAVVDDHGAMLARVEELIRELKENAPPVDQLNESIAFLEWIYSGFFVFTGTAEFALDNISDKAYLSEVSENSFGLLRKYQGDLRQQSVDQLSDGVKALYEDDQVLAVTKSSKRSTVHRDSYSDYIVVKRFNSAGAAVGEVRFMGLYTSQFYSYSPRRIPILREKVNWVMQNSGLNAGSHDGKALQAILDTHPRDELLLVGRDVLAETTIGIWQIYDRRAVKVFMHTDAFDKFVSCLVYLPREIFSTELRDRLEMQIGAKLGATEQEVGIQFVPDSVLVRIYLVYKIDNQDYLQVTSEQLQSLVEASVRDWRSDFNFHALRELGKAEGSALVRRMQSAFSEAYKEVFTPQQALQHVALLSKLRSTDDLAVDLLDDQDSTNQEFALLLFHLGSPLALSDMIPMLENLGFSVRMERPFQIRSETGDVVWMQDFNLTFNIDVDVDVSAVKNSFKDALLRVWRGEAENDSFNRLVVGARLDWRSVAMLRLYARYLKQIGVPFSQDFIADTLSRHLDITRNLVALFKAYFDPRYASESRSERIQGLIKNVQLGLNAIANLNEDNIIRGYLQLIQATQRTNFFQVDTHGEFKSYTSIKLCTQQVEIAPEPRPAYEIFVYSARFEGVHLRGGKVARGGLRWSDRLEDYRTEVLGLVKAQQVKNAVIVPTGAKGGFVAKKIGASFSREAAMQEGVACYQLYIQALLDITDNLIDGQIAPPKDVIRRDADDPYLVVAADKGTATFSDIANKISDTNEFWLGDAFASGGGNGYDHKGMGITARGAWVAVQRHFYELGVDTQSENISVIGVGDMGGDVFGNGMLLSEHIQLLAAFNHLHIFVDPNPTAAASFLERKRLFQTPRCTWDDYDKSLLSSGGAVFSRASKSLSLAPEIMQRFSIPERDVTPNQLINYLLKAQVDLIWNGGIGTYVKASTESHADVGDRANDNLRVDGGELQCRVFGEGGNLGMTQKGRVEYSHGGGRCNSDFIDNAAGVDCSDHEVNIKILLNPQIASGNLSVSDRNTLLSEMTDEVADLVLENNKRQTQSISLAEVKSKQHHSEYQRFLVSLEEAGKLDRDLEHLPSDEQLIDRINRQQPSWTRPELAVLICYSKVVLKEALTDTDLLSDPWLAQEVSNYFPSKLMSRFGDSVKDHPLANDIAVNQLVNDIVNRVGFTFFFRQAESTGASVADVVKAYTVVCQVLGIKSLWQQIESHSPRLSSETELEMLHLLVRLTRRATRWILRNHRLNLDCDSLISQYAEPVEIFLSELPILQKEQWKGLWRKESDDIVALGVDSALSERLACSDSMFISMGVVNIALSLRVSVQQVADVYFTLGEYLSLDWFMAAIVELQPENRWQDLARETYVDDLESQRRRLTAALCRLEISQAGPMEIWQQQQSDMIRRWHLMVADLRNSPNPDFAMISVALKELLNLVMASVDGEQQRG